MTIQFNTDNNLSVHEIFGSKLENMLSEELDRFSEHISRLEVHLSDENGGKEGINDKRCLLEARLEGRQPIAVTALGNTYEQALNNSIEKLKTTLETIQGRIRSTHRG